MGHVQRAAVLIGVAVVVVATVGVRYLGPIVSRPPASPVSTPRPAPAGFARSGVAGMDWISTSTGWVVLSAQSASLLYGTTDGGHHWRQQLVAYGTFTVHFFDRRRGLLLPPPSQAYDGSPLILCTGAAASPCPQLSPGVIRIAPTQPNGGAHLAAYRTDDGGDRWLPVNLPQAAVSSGGSMSFADPTHGWLLSAGSGTPLYRTDDGGDHWTELAPPALPQGEAGVGGSIWFPDVRDGWAASRAPDGSVALLVTHDGGLSWRESALPAPPGGWRVGGPARVVQVAMSGGGGVLVVAMAADAAAWAYVTSDDGDAWADPVLVPGLALRAPVLGPTFVDGRTGWVAQAHMVSVTLDGGRDWQQRAGPAGTSIAGVTGVSSSTAVAVGLPAASPAGPARGLLYATADGGRTWRRLGPGPGLV